MKALIATALVALIALGTAVLAVVNNNSTPTPTPSPTTSTSASPSPKPSPTPTSAPTPTPTPTVAPAANRSGLSWKSGSNGDPAQSAANVDAFAKWRTRAADVAVTYVDRTSWGNITSSSWPYSVFAGWAGQLVISTPFWPEKAGGSLATCATGAYDSQWKIFGSHLVSVGRGNSIVRPGWEFNGNWYEWQATDPAAFKTCFQHVVTAIRSADPQVTIDWTMNSHYSQNPPSHNPMDAYPGDAYVNIMGIDDYDMWPPSLTPAAFTTQANSQGGIAWLLNIAKQHGKKISVPEWGVSHTAAPNGGGDNPVYIQQMVSFFKANASNIAYEAYFNNCDAGNVESDLYRGCSGNIKSAPVYQALYKAG